MAEGPLTLVEVAHLSDTGRVRHHNEDRSLATAALLVVADGMGGAKAGEVAAQMAVDAVGRARRRRPAPTTCARRSSEANRAIRRMARDDADKSGMGTTLTAAMLRDGRLDVVHVGDSRAYLWRDSTLLAGHRGPLGRGRAGAARQHHGRGGRAPPPPQRHHPRPRSRGRGDRRRDVGRPARRRRGAGVQRRALVVRLRGGDRRGAGGRRRRWARRRAAWWRAPTGPGGVDNVTVVLGRVGVGPPAASGDTVEAPVVPRADGGAGTGEVRVLGGVHGHAGAERSGGAPAPPPKVLEPAGRRRSKAVPVLMGVLVLLAVVVGGVAWVASRTYTLEAGPQDTVIVAHGLPVSRARARPVGRVAGHRRPRRARARRRSRTRCRRRRAARARPSSGPRASCGASA